MADEALFLRGVTFFQRRLLPWRMTGGATILRQYRAVNGVGWDERRLFTGSRKEIEPGDYYDSCDDQGPGVFHVLGLLPIKQGDGKVKTTQELFTAENAEGAEKRPGSDLISVINSATSACSAVRKI